MKVRKIESIDGKEVVRVAEFAGLKVYESADEPSVSTLYFARGDDVVQVLRIVADCSQNMGVIGNVSFSGVPKD